MEDLSKYNISPKEESLIKYSKSYAFDFLKQSVKFLLLAVLIGLFCGSIGILFRIITAKASVTFNKFNWLIYILPIAGLVITFLYDKTGSINDRGTNAIIEAVRTNTIPKWVMAPLIFVGTFLTHACGGSSGREGASLQIGGSIGANIGKLLKMDQNDTRCLVMCGMSAVFSAVFGTPIAAAIISIEIISVGIWHYSAFLPCIVSSTIAYGLAGYWGVDSEIFKVVNLPKVSWSMGAKMLLIGFLCALVSILFINALHGTHKLAVKYFENPYLRVLVGAGLVILLTALSFSNRYNGTGMFMIGEFFSGAKIYPWDFAMKIVFTAITVGFGFKGGEIVPAFYVGASFGGFMGSILGIDTKLAIAIGMVAIFCGVMNTPITAIMLGVEIFGAGPIIYFALAAAMSYVFSGYFGLYDSQKIMYSKVRTLYLNKIIAEKNDE